jgi:hypothetical protein
MSADAGAEPVAPLLVKPFAMTMLVELVNRLLVATPRSTPAHSGNHRGRDTAPEILSA